MGYLEESSPKDISLCLDCDKGLRNPWRWSWLDDACNRNIPFRKWCKKIEEGGKCYCVPCGKILIYGSSGKKALRNHANHLDHIAKLDSAATNYKLVSKDEDSDSVTLSDRASELKSIVSLFLAENSLPFTLAPNLVDFAKRLSSDAKTLQSLSFNRTAATYTTTHGVGHAIKESLMDNLSGKHFSLNIDEATNNAGSKFLNIMVQYFSEKAEKCVVQLLGVKEVNISTAQNITDAVCAVLEERKLDCSKIVSVLMDNCNVMRRKKSGVETRLRAVNPNMLDINGDTVHTLNNAAKKFFHPIETFLPLQTLCSDLFYDIEESPKVREIFAHIQLKLFQKARSVVRPIPNRFNQMLTVATRVSELWDALIIYYACFVEAADMKNFSGRMTSIHVKYNLNDEDVSCIKDMLKKQKEQQKSNTNSDRKDRIIHYLFDKSEQTHLILSLYRGVLNKFEKFIKLFQSNKPLVHVLHVELFSVMKDFFSFFIKPEHIPLYDAKKLSKLDYTDPDVLLKKTDLYVGEFCKPQLLLYSRDRKSHQHWLDKFYSALREAYVACATGMLKLPLLNETIIQLSHLSPGCQRSDTTGAAVLKLAQKLPNVIAPEHLGSLDDELKSYTTDTQISLLDVNEEDPDVRLDSSWWSTIFNINCKGQQKYPLLSKLVKALLSIFCGPLVEASFNIMDDILRSDRSRMTPQNYEALAMIKSDLMARGESATTIKVTPSMKAAVSSAYSRYQASTSSESSTKSCDKSHNASESQSHFSVKPSSSSKTSTNSNEVKEQQASNKRKQPTIGSFFAKRQKSD